MFVYNLFIRCYGFAINTAALFSNKAKKWVKGRKNWISHLPDTEKKKVVWFHCASLGEFDQALPIIEKWNKNYFILVTFFSPSGYENKKQFKGADYTCYLPLDTPKNAQTFVSHFQPELAFFVKYEFWLNYIDALNLQGTKLFSLSTVLRQDQHFFKWYGKIFIQRLEKFTHFFAQNNATKELLEQLKINQSTVTGDTRFDRVLARKNNISPNPFIQNWLSNERAIVIGSSWEKDEAVVFPFIKDYSSKVIIAPHEVNEPNIKRLLKQLQKKYFCYSTLLHQQASEIPNETEILVLDCIGVLADAYYFGKLAYVGGAFGNGLHNILEPAAFGLPVIFGPNFSKFPEAQLFIEQGIGKSISSPQEFKAAFEHFEKEQANLSAEIDDFMEKQSGATSLVFKWLAKNELIAK
jgi:3-deoxy-D-manno-octulosonic-acid transferase